MILQNTTPFVPMLFQSRDVHGQDSWVLVVRGTFQIAPSGVLALDPEQAPVVTSDVHHGDTLTSSLRMESDVVPFKPRTDVLIDAVAHAPGGRPKADWPVRVQVGAIDKTLRVTGPRRWAKDGSEHRLSAPDPCLEVPIRYERAFGGVWQNNWGDRDVFHENPLGVGYVKPGEAPGDDDVPAPQIESPDDPIDEIGRIHRPQGLGPIHRGWAPRLALAGTYDDRWRVERGPELPLDFTHDFCNGAHPDLIHPGYLEGDAEVRLEGLHPEGPMSFRLPGYRVELLIKRLFGQFQRLPLALDTLAIDVPGGRAYLIWRTRAPKQVGVRAFDVIAVRGSDRS